MKVALPCTTALEREVAEIHQELFGSPPSVTVVACYCMAHEVNPRLTRLSEEEKNLVGSLVDRNVPLIAAEFWWRRKAPENVLSAKVYLTCLLNESIEGFVRSQNPLGVVATLWAAIEDLVKLFRTRKAMGSYGLL